MAESDNILTKLQDLLVYLIPQLNKFPRDQKFVLGDRIETKLLDVQEDCLRAYYSRDKRGQAIDYTLKRWTALNQFVEDGTLEIDNNLIENAIRPSALGKRNWMFIGHPEAGERSAVIYTLLGSCRRHGINPFDYLKDLFTRLPAAKITQIKQFTPAMWVRARTGASQPAEENLP